MQQLIELCEELVVLLQKNDNKNWAGYFNHALGYLKNSDMYGCQAILEAYGGMGSFNDFSLKQPGEEAKRQELSGRIYILATKLMKKKR